MRLWLTKSETPPAKADSKEVYECRVCHKVVTEIRAVENVSIADTWQAGKDAKSLVSYETLHYCQACYKPEYGDVRIHLSGVDSFSYRREIMGGMTMYGPVFYSPKAIPKPCPLCHAEQK